MLLLSMTIGSGATAHDDSDEEEAAPVAGEQQFVRQRQFVLTEQQVDQMVLGGQQVVQRANGGNVVQGVVAQTSADFRKRMETTAAAEIETINRRVSLTEAQKKKLKLAASGDIAQFVSRADKLRPKLTSKPLKQQQYAELIRDLQPLQIAQQFGTSGENSLFRKTLRHTLTEEQRVRWQTLERERQKAVIETAIQTWERTANGVKLAGESRQKFIDVLLDYGVLPKTRSSYIYYVVLVEAGKLEDSLKPIVSDEIWEKLQPQITQAKQVEVTFRNSGQWPARSTEDDDGLAHTTKE